jgi:hypothetical protein
MHKNGLFAKEWTKNDPNLGAKAMFFPRTRKTLLEKPRKNQS